MLKRKTKFFIYLLVVIILMPLSSASALFMPANGSELADMSGVSAKAYVVINTETGEVLAAKIRQCRACRLH